jgi:hypothetical protein
MNWSNEVGIKATKKEDDNGVGEVDSQALHIKRLRRKRSTEFRRAMQTKWSFFLNLKPSKMRRMKKDTESNASI